MYSRPGCHLCETAGEVIRHAQARLAFEFRVVDIGGDRDLEARFGSDIPVVHVNGRPAFKYRVESAELEREIERWNP
jgi:hypothetical protein